MKVSELDLPEIDLVSPEYEADDLWPERQPALAPAR